MIRDVYLRMVRDNHLKQDAAQAEVVDAMQVLHDELLHAEQSAGDLRNVIARAFGVTRPAPMGMYIWGGVGRGKTVLMNMFHDSLPLDNKLRRHFHRFMLDIHAELAALRKTDRSLENPLTIVARQYAERYRVICLDEFIVTNITDAMILYALLDTLLENGVVLIATSNRVPDDLYLNGLQRDRFLPAIDLINQRLNVHHLDSGTDHRIELLATEGTYHTPLNDDTRQAMEQEFSRLSSGEIHRDGNIRINDRDIAYVARSDNCIWFRFDVLCESPRAAPDYISITEAYDAVFLSEVPPMDEEIDDMARRFIYLIDELYDNRVSLVISAAAPVDELYRGERLAFAFRRTGSRLMEMQSSDYIEQSSRRSVC